MKGHHMKKALSLLLILCLLPLAGCGNKQEESSAVTVMATFYPVYVLAENVLEGVEGVELISMTPPSTGCLHDYQLLTRDIKALSAAKALLCNGAGMESFLGDVKEQYPDLMLVNCSRGVALLREEEEHGEHEDHDHGEYNAHIWLSPRNAVIMVENIRAAMAQLLPEKQEQIDRNAAAYTKRLSDLDAELSAAIGALPRKTIVTFHEAFPYFAEAYGLQVAAVVALEPDEPLSPRMLAEVVEKVKAAGNPPLFSEPQYESAALQAVAQETGARVYELDPLVTGDGALTAYEDTLRKNLRVLQEALGE